ncbi:MAG: A/G-specific adenine glycosylase [Johnsonella sp.]|nr:A/G-specific adenine glycosylase [Johnsonella sp.]
MSLHHEPHPLSSALIGWYDLNARDLPWRRSPSPYHVWLSEIMLQQTRVEAVKGYYRRFLDALPDISSLAHADEDTCMKLWEGLGYYSRVRNLHKAAKQIMEEYGGIMPSSYTELLNIAGIGPYTAAAIASIVFGEVIPAIDGNLLRVFARLSSYPESIKEAAAKKAAHAFFLECMPKDRPGDFNQALMDLGATICLPNGKPLCSSCPLSGFCRSFCENRTADFPLVPAKKARSIEKRTVFLIHDSGKIAIKKRPKRGLLAGLYEFPNCEEHLDEDAVIRYSKSLGFSPIRIKKLGFAKHVFTHKEWDMIGYDILTDALEPYPSSSHSVEALKIAESSGQALSPLFTKEESPILLVHLKDIREYYSIPSAFKKFKEYLD